MRKNWMLDTVDDSRVARRGGGGGTLSARSFAVATARPTAHVTALVSDDRTTLARVVRTLTVDATVAHGNRCHGNARRLSATERRRQVWSRHHTCRSPCTRHLYQLSLTCITTNDHHYNTSTTFIVVVIKFKERSCIARLVSFHAISFHLHCVCAATGQSHGELGRFWGSGRTTKFTVAAAKHTAHSVHIK